LIVTLEGLNEYSARIEKLRQEMDQLVPGVREELIIGLEEQASLTEEEKAAMKIPADQRTDEEVVLAQRADQKLWRVDNTVDLKVFANAKPDVALQAKRILDEIVQLHEKLHTIGKYSGTMNYQFWKARTDAESTEQSVRARQALYDAIEMRRRSIFDDEYEMDFKTKEKKIVQRGAIRLHEDAFKLWSDILQDYPELQRGEVAEDMIAGCVDYREMLNTAGLKWPDNFPLQWLIDQMDQSESNYNLPNSEDLAERRAAEGDGSPPAEGQLKEEDKATPAPADDSNPSQQDSPK
jgi:hypothetical protein